MMTMVPLREERQLKSSDRIRLPWTRCHRSLPCVCCTELDWHLGVKGLDSFDPQHGDQPIRLPGSHRHHNCHRLIGQLDEMARVNASVMAEAFACGNERCPADT